MPEPRGKQIRGAGGIRAGSSRRGGWRYPPAGAGKLWALEGGDVGEGQQRSDNCVGRRTGRWQRRAEPRTSDVRSGGIPLGESGLRCETPGVWGGGSQSPPCFPRPLPRLLYAPPPSSPLVGKFLESLPSGLCGSNMAELTVEVRGSNGAFYKVLTLLPLCRVFWELRQVWGRAGGPGE